MDGFFDVYKKLPREDRTFFSRYVALYYPDAAQLHKALAFLEDRQLAKAETIDDEVLYRWVWQVADQVPLRAAELKKASNLLSDLKKRLIEALTMQQAKTQQNRPEVQLLRLEALSSQKVLANWHDKALKSLKKDIEAAISPDKSLDMWDYAAHLKIADYTYYQMFYVQNCAPRLDNTTELLDNIQCFYAAGLCKYAAEAWERNLIAGEQYDTLETDKIIAFTESVLHKSPKSLKLYLDLLKLACDKYTDAEFDVLGQQIIQETEKPNNETFILLKSLINAAGRAVNKGKAAYRQKAFDLICHGMENDLLLINSLLLVELYTNMVSLGATLGLYDKTRYFVDRYAHKLPKEEVENANFFSRAKLYFEEGKYKEALPYLEKVDKNDIGYSLRVRVMYIQCYFELQDDRMENEMNNLGAFVSRKVKGKNPKQGATNFLKMMKKLLNYNNTKTEMLEALSAEQNIYCRVWLESKIIESKVHKP